MYLSCRIGTEAVASPLKHDEFEPKDKVAGFISTLLLYFNPVTVTHVRIFAVDIWVVRC